MTEQLVGVIPEFTICDRLRKARELTGLDQAPFADEIGVSRGTVSNYERDPSSAFKLIVLRAWAMRTGVPVEWLQTGVAPHDTDPDDGLPVERPRQDSNLRPRHYKDAGSLAVVVPLTTAA